MSFDGANHYLIMKRVACDHMRWAAPWLRDADEPRLRSVLLACLRTARAGKAETIPQGVLVWYRTVITGGDFPVHCRVGIIHTEGLAHDGKKRVAYFQVFEAVDAEGQRLFRHELGAAPPGWHSRVSHTKE